ncbi:rubrerythrin [bacterium BMS3Bbin05]|nr:rubrerythrin [bacterium BMS3Bbin05]
MTEFSIREAIEMAIQTEKMGYNFYSVMAEKHKENGELSKLFDTLAKKEQVHEKRFTELRDIIGEKEPEDWGEVAPYMRAIVESAFFLGKENATMHMQNIQDVRAAVSFAIAFEKETLLFFHGIKDAVKERDIIDEVINEEKSHIMWLNRFRK